MINFPPGQNDWAPVFKPTTDDQKPAVLRPAPTEGNGALSTADDATPPPSANGASAPPDQA